MEIKKVNPKSLFNRKRLDLIIKYLYAKEILEKENNLYSKSIYKDLYIRHILMRTGGVTSPLETVQKEGINDYCKEYENLIHNIKTNGFNADYPVAISNDGLISNGAHRISAAAALNTDVAIVEKNDGHTWDFKWFCDNGFNTEDKQRILKGYVDIKSGNSILFIILNPLFKYEDNIKTVLNKYFDIVGDVELDFENNYIAFTNSLLEIYERNIAQNNGDESGILAKAKFLLSNRLSYKVIVVTNEDKNKDKSITDLSKDCKEEIRNLFNHILPKEIFCTVHSSDGQEESHYLSDILLSQNNIKHLKMRLNYETDGRLVKLLRDLPDYLKNKEINIPSNDICVIGTGVLSALGINKHHDSDIDFIVSHNHREKFGWGSYHLNDNYEIGVSSKQANGPICDDIIIYNDDYHFWFKGIKFANLEIIKDRKSSKARPKDIFHLRQIELFENLHGYVNQLQILQERIRTEQERRKILNNSIVSTFSYSNFLERLFSIKNQITNNSKYKVITILGIKIKFKANI